jgi:hypothetical protein
MNHSTNELCMNVSPPISDRTQVLQEGKNGLRKLPSSYVSCHRSGTYCSSNLFPVSIVTLGFVRLWSYHSHTECYCACALQSTFSWKHSATESIHEQYFALLCSMVLPCWPKRRRRACSSRKWESSSWRISHRAKPTSRIVATVGTTSDQRVALNSSCSLSWERPPQVRHCNTQLSAV